jgi:hypothetical protein
VSKQSPNNLKLAERADEHLNGWLARMEAARLALREFVGENGQPSRFQPMTQWFTAPRGLTILVTPPANVALEGGNFSVSYDDRDRQTNVLYTSEEPFFGGVAVRACLNEEFMSDDGIVADLVCMRTGFDRRPPVFSDSAPNASFQGEAVFIPKFIPSQVDLTIIVGPGPTLG